MDKEKFDQLVSQHADYIYTTDASAPAPRGPKSQQPSAAESNPTGGLKILKFWPRQTLCDDCLIIKDSAPVRSLLWNFNKRSWMIRCVTCRQSFNKQTGRFEKGSYNTKEGPHLPKNIKTKPLKP